MSRRRFRNMGITDLMRLWRAFPVQRSRLLREIGFRELCYGDNPVANRAHFFKIYDAIVERAVNESMVPAAVLEKEGNT